VVKKLLFIAFILMFFFSLASCPEPDTEKEDEEIEIEIDPTLEEIIAEQLAGQEGKGTAPDNPAVLTLEINIGDMQENSNWHKILIAIEAEEKYIDLDLSGCSKTITYFNPNYEIKDGKDKIVKITLPDAAETIIGVDTAGYSERAFVLFTNLEYASGKNIIHIGSFAFADCNKLKGIEFPNVIDIGTSVFNGCSSLIEADFLLLTMIGNNSFNGCASLKTVNFPELTNIKPYTFYNCTSLETAAIPKAAIIDQFAFYNCISLTEADFPLVETLGNNAFRNCESLTDVEFPYVKTINPGSFMDCNNLVTVSFATAEIIGNEAFRNCINLKTAAFLGNPEQETFPPHHPLDPWREGKGLFTEDCFVIYDDAFYGCKSLEVLDIRKAWNIYFAGGCLADIGTHLDMYLFDDDGTKSYGHPPIDFFLGGGNDKGPLTLVSLNIYIPQSGTKVEHSHPGPEAGYHGIKVWVSDILKITVKIERLP